MILAFLIPVIMLFQGFGTIEGTDENAVKAMFIYNIAKYFDWSQIMARPDFVIAVYGNSPVSKYLNDIAGRKTLNGKSITIKIIYSASECTGTQMLFIPENSSNVSEIFNSATISESVIIITESRVTFNKGSHINFVNVNGKLRFKLNELRMKNNNIKYSKELSSLAIK